MFPTSSSIPNLSVIPCRPSLSLHEKETAHLDRPLTEPCCSLDSADCQFVFLNRTSPGSPELPLRLCLWRLLFLFFSTRRAQRTNIGLHLLPLVRRQEFHHLRASVVSQLMNLRFLLIRR